MEKLRVLNPDTQSIIEAEEIRNLPPELYSIISFSLSLYNSALDNFNARKYESAWQHISDSVSLFPYADIPLVFAFELSLELGEYQCSRRMLDLLTPFLDEKELRRLADQLDEELSIYNMLVTDSENDADPDGYQRLVHRVLLSLIKGDNLLTGSDLDAKGVRTTPQYQSRQSLYKYVTFLTMPLVVIGIVLLIYSNYNSERSNRVLLSQKAQIDILDSTLNVKVEDLRSQRALNQFYKAYHLPDYTECAHVLSDHKSLVDTLAVIDSSIVENVCAQLYKADLFQLVLDIPFASSFHIHSYFQQILSTTGETRRDQKIAFIQRYPESHIYTPPLLRELYDTEADGDQRIEYAIKLHDLVNDPATQDLQFLITNTMISELEQSRGISASKQ